jgi:LPS O-antigen subunit length determinant protein (WzzB/FepE family)
MPYCWAMRRFLLAAVVCAAVGVLMGLGYAALTPPPLTAKALIVLPQGTPAPGLGSHDTRLTANVVEVSAQGSTAGQAVSADAAAARSYLARAVGAQLLDPVTIVPRRGGRLPALAALGALVGALAGTLGALTGRATYRL